MWFWQFGSWQDFPRWGPNVTQPRHHVSGKPAVWDEGVIISPMRAPRPIPIPATTSALPCNIAKIKAAENEHRLWHAAGIEWFEGPNDAWSPDWSRDATISDGPQRSLDSVRGRQNEYEIDASFGLFGWPKLPWACHHLIVRRHDTWPARITIHLVHTAPCWRQVPEFSSTPVRANACWSIEGEAGGRIMDEITPSRRHVWPNLWERRFLAHARQDPQSSVPQSLAAATVGEARECDSLNRAPLIQRRLNAVNLTLPIVGPRQPRQHRQPRLP